MKFFDRNNPAPRNPDVPQENQNLPAPGTPQQGQPGNQDPRPQGRPNNYARSNESKNPGSPPREAYNSGTQNRRKSFQQRRGINPSLSDLGEAHTRRIPQVAPGKVRFIPLGGNGWVTKNMYLYEYGSDILIVDCGMGFPEEHMLGVDFVIPDVSYLKDKINRVRGMIITHAHEDHIGGLPYILSQIKVPVYATKLTIGLVKVRLAEMDLADKVQLNVIDPRDHIKLGVFDIDPFRVSHSVPDAVGYAITTPAGTTIHTGDFKFDWTPVDGRPTDAAKIVRLTQHGCLALMSDCLRSERSGYTLSEAMIEESFDEIISKATGKVVITTFSSNISRIQQAIDVSRRYGRKVVVSGRSMDQNLLTAKELGYINLKPEWMARPEQAMKMKDHQVTYIVSGAQGQQGSALWRIANSEHRFISVHEGDTIIFSSDPIPGNQDAVYTVIDKLSKLGATVHYSDLTDEFHVSVLPKTNVLVRNKKGQIKLEEIQNVDEELEAYSFNQKSHRSSWHRAQKIEHPYKGKTYKITTKSGRSVEVTKGHSLFALKLGQLVEVKSENLKIGDYLVIPKKLPYLESKVPQELDLTEFVPKNSHYTKKDNFIFYDRTPIAPAKLAVENDLMRLLGYYLANGSAPRHLAIVSNSLETDQTAEIISLIRKVLGCSARGSAREITFGTPALGKVFKSWFGKNPNLKDIPYFVLNASKEQKLSFLGAYIVGSGEMDEEDGHSQIRIKTPSRKLASDLLYLFSSTGIIAQLSHERKIVALPSQPNVIRIQGPEYINQLLPFLSKEYHDHFERYYSDEIRSLSQTPVSEYLPITETSFLKQVVTVPSSTSSGTYFDLKKRIPSLTQTHPNPALINRDFEGITNALQKCLDGDLFFDPIKKIEEDSYEGPVYDLSVPGPENFLGGFGGIYLHNSGHAAQAELILMMSLCQPKYLVPVSGVYRQLSAYKSLAMKLGHEEKNIWLLEEGDMLEMDPSGIRKTGKIPVENIMVDGLGVGDVGSIVLRDRQVLSEEGLVIVLVNISKASGELVGNPDVISRGFVYARENEKIIHDIADLARKIMIQKPGRIDWSYAKVKVHDELERFIFTETQRRPMILPLVMEV
jgi:mRNA degradation ribonuclease J1/J2/intein/homing endonuclease